MNFVPDAPCTASLPAFVVGYALEGLGPLIYKESGAMQVKKIIQWNQAASAVLLVPLDGYNGCYHSYSIYIVVSYRSKPIDYVHLRWSRFDQK